KRRSLRLHRRMATSATAVALQRDLDVLEILPAELRHVVRRIRVVRVRHSVATLARLGEHAAPLRIALDRERGERRRRNGWGARGGGHLRGNIERDERGRERARGS